MNWQDYEYLEEEFDELPTVEKIRRKPKRKKEEDDRKEQRRNKVEFALNLNSQY